MKELAQVSATPSDQTFTYIPRHRYLIDDVDEVPRPAVQLASGVSQRPAIARPLFLESEKPIPSVESDPYVHGRQELLGMGNQPSHPTNPFQDRSIGPRIIEFYDDASSPAQKRRRVEDGVAPSSKVTYKYERDEPSSASVAFGPNRRNGYSFSDATPSSQAQQKRPQYDQGAPHLMDSVPSTNLARDFADLISFDGVSHHTNRNAIREKHATYVPSGLRSEYKQQLYPPASQPQPSLLQNLPQDPHSRSNVSRFMPPSSLHERGTVSHPSITASYPSFNTYPAQYTEVARSNDLQDRSLHEVPVRLKPPEHVEHTAERYSYIKPALDRVYEVPTRIPSSATGLASHMFEPPRQSYRHDQSIIQTSPLRKTDCPEGARGSFCNRVGNNGFTRMDDLNEHMRKVHSLEPRYLRSAPDQNPFGHSLHTYTNEACMERPQDVLRSGYPQRSRNQEVIYIDSSPVMEGR